MECCADVNNYSTLSLFHACVEDRLTHVEGPKRVNLKDLSNSIRWNLFGTRQEVSCSSVNKDIDMSKLLDNSFHNLLARFYLGNISRLWEARAELTQVFSNSLVLFFIPGHQDNSLRSMDQVLLCYLFEHTAARPPSYQAHFSLVKFVREDTLW
jgi:hypothetical protein